MYIYAYIYLCSHVVSFNISFFLVSYMNIYFLIRPHQCQPLLLLRHLDSVQSKYSAQHWLELLIVCEILLITEWQMVLAKCTISHKCMRHYDMATWWQQFLKTHTHTHAFKNIITTVATIALRNNDNGMKRKFPDKRIMGNLTHTHTRTHIHIHAYTQIYLNN